MALNDNQLKALDLVMSCYPDDMTYDEIAEKCGVEARTLRRWRNSEDWKEEWEKRDLSEIDRALRRQVIERGDSGLFKVYYERHGGLTDGDVMAKALRMSEEHALKIAEDASKWLQSLE